MKKIKIVKYNCHLELPFVKQDDATRRKETINRLRASGTDIIGLCEVWAEYGNAIEIIDKLADIYPYFLFRKTSALKAAAHGLVVLSKYPIYDSGLITYAYSCGSDSLSEKGFYYMCVNVTSQEGKNHDFRLFFTHTQSGADSKEADIRSKQFTQMKSIINTYHAGTPSLIMGDLNIDPDLNKTEYNNLFSNFFTNHIDFYKTNHSDYGYTYDTKNKKLAQNWGGDEKPQRLDYMIGSKDMFSDISVQVETQWKCRDSQYGDCSDHYPLIAEQVSLVKESTIKPLNVFDNSEQALQHVDDLKKAYGTGCSAKLLIANLSETGIDNWRNIAWKGSFYENPPPYIDAYKVSGVFFHHPDGEALGAEGAMIFSIRNTNLIAVLCFLVPHSDFYTNKCYVEVMDKSQWSAAKQEQMRTKLNDSGYQSISEQMVQGKKYTALAKMDKGDSPVCIFAFRKV